MNNTINDKGLWVPNTWNEINWEGHETNMNPFLSFPKRHNTWSVLLWLHCYADPRRLVRSAVWRNPRVRDLSRDRLNTHHAHTNCSAHQCRSSNYSQGDRGVGFGKWTNYRVFSTSKQASRQSPVSMNHILATFNATHGSSLLNYCILCGFLKYVVFTIQKWLC